MKPTNKLPTPSEAGLPDNVLREINQAVASSLQHDEGRRGTGGMARSESSYTATFTADRGPYMMATNNSLGRTGVP